MTKELDNFIIESDLELNYFDEIVHYIKDNEKRILDFFELDKLPKKITILILSYEPFKEFILSKFGSIKEYTRGDTDVNTNTIRLLNIEDQIKYTTHKDANIDQMKKTALHEVVHICHLQYHNDYNKTLWFIEGLATNLSNQDYELVNLNECDFENLKNNFYTYKDSYKYAYTIVNYILNNYSKEEITKLYKDPNYVRQSGDVIFNEAKVWANEQTYIK